MTDGFTAPRLAPLDAVLATLTVGLIMVQRQNWMTCTCETLRTDLAVENTTTQYSTIPVVDTDDRVVGLHDASRWFKQAAPASPVGSDFQPLSEDILIAEDASIFEFLRQADRHPTNLVVKGTRIAGLVSLSDIQQLPVRAALFALVTNFEMALAAQIAHIYKADDDWKALLSSGRRGKLADKVKEARAKDIFTSELLFTEFCDKRTIVVEGHLMVGDGADLTKRIKAIEGLRNNLAHSNDYASTPELAKSVCAVVRDIYDLKEMFVSTQPALAR